MGIVVIKMLDAAFVLSPIYLYSGHILRNFNYWARNPSYGRKPAAGEKICLLPNGRMRVLTYFR